jgi:LuxR family maltose regulon positive regulatory protein
LKQVLGWAAQGGAVNFALGREPEFSRLVTEWIGSRDSASHEQVRKHAADLLARIRRREMPPPAETPRPARQGLTDRECRIVAFIAAGQSNKEIARALGVAPETIKTHIKRIFVKLSAETRAQAVVRAQSLGLLRGTQPEVPLAS